MAPASNVHSPAAPTSVPACAGGGGQVLTGTTGTWTVLPAPHFPTGPAQATAHAVDPLDPKRWFVTNGKAVLRSANDGCTWTPVYALPAGRPDGSLLSRDTDTVAAISVATGSSNADAVHLAVEVLAEASPDAPVAGEALPPEQTGRVAAATAVVTSEDDGRTWRPPALLAHSPGAPGPLRAAPGDPHVVYAVAGGGLSVSRDGGRSWEARPPVTDPDQAASDPDVAHLIRDLAVDPLDPDELWVRSGASLLRSTDGGRSWVRLTEITGTGLHGPEVIHPAGVLARLLVTTAPDPSAPLEAMIVSDDAGRTWRRFPLEVTGSHQSMTHGAPDELVLTTAAAVGSPAGVYRTAAGAAFGEVDQFGLAPLLDVQAQRGTTTAFHFRAPTGLVIYRPAAPPPAGPPGGAPTRRPVDPGDPTPPPIPSFDPPPRPPPPPARLEPARFAVPLAPGGSASVQEVLDLPAQPSPLDVFLLVDTSGSMDPVIHELARGLAELVRRLTAAGIDAHIGLGEFQGIAEDEVRYRRRVDISPPGPALQAALGDLRTRGGEEPHLTALHQMATGAGLPAPGTGAAVPAGQQANWRMGSLRVVVMPTDEAFGYDPDGPNRDTTVAALRAAQVRHIGIEVPAQGSGDAADDTLDLDGRGELRTQLEDLSRATGALAPDGGVDCDG
ncbi:MAG TPA: hypothetical protein VHF25_03890, partial [Nitriliruptorales bacterium]|nr:hypothetical protein [Nitriliruptorales bacterium]